MTAQFISLLLVFGLTVHGQVSQHGNPCGGMDIIDVGIHVRGYKVSADPPSYSEISADSLRKGFILESINASYKVTSFVIYFSRKQKVTEYSVEGANASPKALRFLTNIRAGDQLSLECINIATDSTAAISTSFQILVTK